MGAKVMLSKITELLEKQITFRAVERILECASNIIFIAGRWGLILFMGKGVYLLVVGINSSLGWEDKLTFLTYVND